MFELTKLETLDIQFNALTGMLVGDLMAKLTSLTQIRLGDNAFVGDENLLQALWDKPNATVIDLFGVSVVGESLDGLEMPKMSNLGT